MSDRKSQPVIRMLLMLLAWGWSISALAADRVVLKDGRAYEGDIVKEDDKYLHIQTAQRKRVFRKTEISEIIRDIAKRAQAALPKKFTELDPLSQEVHNARAEQVLGKYDSIVPRLEPLVAQGSESPEMTQARWLLIQAYERLGRFDQATQLLEEMTRRSSQPDRIRARAHLDIFEQNQGHKLEQINDKLAKKFLPRELYLKGKRPGALSDKELMDRALQEYVDQILRNPKVSLQAFKDSLELDETVEQIRNLPPAGRRLEKHLPYGGMLEQVAESLERAQAILPNYADGYLLDLVRTEAEHLSGAIDLVFRELVDKYPESFSYAYDPANGKLTKEGREQWRENCETFLTESKPLTLVVRYQLKKVAAYPRELRDLNRQLQDTLDRLEQMCEAITRKKDTRIYV